MNIRLFTTKINKVEPLAGFLICGSLFFPPVTTGGYSYLRLTGL
jgi:hypothetical protein